MSRTIDKLTDDFCRSAVCPGGTNQEITFERQVPGFGLRVMASGVKSFVFQYRYKGKQKRLTIGRYEEGQDKPLTVAGARTRAKDARRQLVDNIDPLADREADRQERKDDLAAPTVADLCERYLEATAKGKKAKRPKTQKQDRRMVDTKILPAMGKVKVKDLTTLHVSKFLDDITAGKLPGQRPKADGSKEAPYEANRAHSMIRHMLNLAVKWGVIERNPALDWERNEETHRMDFLDLDQVKRLWAVMDAHDQKCSADAVKLLLLTGCRKNEVLEAKWSEFDLAEGKWTVPQERHKSKHPHPVALDAIAMNILTWRLKDNDGRSEYVFPGVSNAVPKKDVRAFFRSCCLAADIKPRRLHDLRHTHASLLFNDGFDVAWIGKALGHSGAHVTTKYTHAFLGTRHEMAGAIGKMITSK